MKDYPLSNWQPVKIEVSVLCARFRVMSRAAECKTDWRVFVAVMFI